MAGVVGLLVKKGEHNSDLKLQSMTRAISHRKCESYHTISRKDAMCLIVGPRSYQGPDEQLFIIDRNENLISEGDIDNVVSISSRFGIVAVIVGKEGVSLLRTLDGTRTLYYGSIKKTFAFATERKCLWTIGIKLVQVLEPGQAITISWDGNISLKRFANLRRPAKTNEARKGTLDVLMKKLSLSFERIRKDIPCAVLFSGGVDSSLAAFLVAKNCNRTLLVTTRSEGAHDDLAAVKAAKLMDLPLNIVELTPEVVWNTLPELIYSIETCQHMNVEIALPFYLASKKAAEEGCSTVVSGQGPDELFAGYARHVKIYKEHGPEALEEQLWKEVSITHEMNIERDERAIAAHGVESFFPYLDQDFVQASLSVPVEWKVSLGKIPQRKVIFRELARLLGVPVEITLTPKSATQYSSGSSKVLFDSIIHHVDRFKEMSKRRAVKQVQDILDEIAYHIQVPNIKRKDNDYQIDFEAADRFLEMRDKSSASNTW